MNGVRRLGLTAIAVAFASGATSCRAGEHAVTPQKESAPARAAAAPSAPASSVDAGADPPSGTPATASADPTAEPTPKASPRKELPRGGRQIFPAYRVVGFCGTPGGPALGRLTGNLAVRTKQLLAQAAKYGESRPLLPAFELIAVVVQGAPGADKKWRRRVPDSVVDEYLRYARESKGILILNIQPGHSDFLTEVKHFERWLREPDVGVALDPEWAMSGKQRPGATFGQTTGAVINEVADYLAGLVREGDLPEKILVYHQVNTHVVKGDADIVARPGVAIVQGVDGLGPKGAKINTYNFLMKTRPAASHPGFKLFFDEDTANGWKLMTPTEVLGLTPEPEYVMYE